MHQHLETIEWRRNCVSWTKQSPFVKEEKKTFEIWRREKRARPSCSRARSVLKSWHWCVLKTSRPSTPPFPISLSPSLQRGALCRVGAVLYPSAKTTTTTMMMTVEWVGGGGVCYDVAQSERPRGRVAPSSRPFPTYSCRAVAVSRRAGDRANERERSAPSNRPIRMINSISFLLYKFK